MNFNFNTKPSLALASPLAGALNKTAADLCTPEIFKA